MKRMANNMKEEESVRMGKNEIKVLIVPTKNQEQDNIL